MNLGVARDNGPRLYCDKASTTPTATAWATLGSSFLGKYVAIFSRADKQTPQLKVDYNSTLRPRKNLGFTRVLKREIFLSVQKKKKK